MNRTTTKRTVIWIIIVAMVAFTAAAATLRADPPPAAPVLRAAWVSPAASQPADRDPAVIFHDEFASAPDDPARDVNSRYLEYNRVGQSFVWRPAEGMGGRVGAMKAQFEKGQVTAGDVKVLFGKNPLGRGVHRDATYHEIYWRVYVMHEAGWTGNPAKLGRATCLATPDWSQGFIAHVWGGKGDVLCIDPATGIVNNQRVSVKYNDFDHLHWLGYRQTQTPIFSTAESGRWVCVESHVRLNTPGLSDGVFELWVDGKLEASRRDLNWQGTWSDYGINAMFLENYWNQGATKREARWFSDFAISTQPIGPTTATATPVITRTAGSVQKWQAEASSDPDGDADGKNIVWTSQPITGARMGVALDAAHGSFSVSRAQSSSLALHTVYWIRLREQTKPGVWSDWSVWHAPFRSAP